MGVGARLREPAPPWSFEAMTPPDRHQPHSPSLPNGPAPDPTASRARFIRTLVGVFSMQAVALALLWLLQARYGG